MDVGRARGWVDPGVVAGFAAATPNRDLLVYAARKRPMAKPLRILDIGCGAGRNAVPLAEAGAQVMGTDLSLPMLLAANERLHAAHVHLAQAPMHALPVRERSFDLIVAHGIWNLASSGEEFRLAVAEAGRAAAHGAALFVFTFSRNTLPPDADPISGESFVFTQFSGAPQIFLTREQLLEELGEVGFELDPDLQLLELNLPPPGQVRFSGAPVIYQAGFQKRGDGNGRNYSSS